jgi:hypothetical protein
MGEPGGSEEGFAAPALDAPAPFSSPTRWVTRHSAIRAASALLFATTLAAPGARAQSTQASQPASVDTIARETSDPTSDVWMIPTTFGFAVTPSVPYRQSNQFSIEVQPAMPVSFDDRWRLLNFPSLTLASQGTPTNTQATGVQSMSYLAAFSPKSTRGAFAWGLGPYVSFPVTTDRDLGVNQWQFGGGGMARIKTKDLIASVTVKAGWATARQRQQAGTLQIEYNFQRFLKDGWQVGLGRNTTVEYSWRQGGGGVWNVPVGLDVAKTTYLGKLPVKFMAQYELMVVNANRWKPQHQVSLVVIPVLQNPP